MKTASGIKYRKGLTRMLFNPDWMRSIAERLERLKSHANIATALGSIPASSDTYSGVWKEARYMRQCGTKYLQNPKKPPLMIFKSWSSRIISGLIGELFVLVISVHCFEQWTCIMRPKALGLAQHGGPPGRPEESDPAGVILNVMDGPYTVKKVDGKLRQPDRM
jgi:hypothetical protein